MDGNLAIKQALSCRKTLAQRPGWNRPAAARPTPRASCDAPQGRADSTARRGDAFAALATAVRIDFGPVFTGEWTGRWTSRMPLARLFFVLEPGRDPGFLSDADATIPLLRNAWAFLPPGREIEHCQPPGFQVVSVHFRIVLKGRPNPFWGRPMRGGASPEMRPAFFDMALESDAPAPDGNTALLPASFSLRGAVWTLLGRVALAEGEALAAGLARGAAFARLFEAVDNDPEKDLSVLEMAKIVRMGESAFKQRFRAEMGVSPRNWFNDRRARAAAEALLEPGATVAAVAGRFGFGNEFYFSRFFRRHHGVPPSQWRRQCHV